MLRQSTAPRTSFADSPRRVHGMEMARQPVAGAAARVVRLLAAPLAALGALVAGALFVILLPVCGIASIAQGIAFACWRFLRAGTRPGSRAGAISR
jgi:hypothetical protein